MPESSLAEAVDLQGDGRGVVLKNGHTIEFDSLVVATGAKNHYFGNDHWAEFATGLKSLEDATRIRHRIRMRSRRPKKNPIPRSGESG